MIVLDFCVGFGLGFLVLIFGVLDDLVWGGFGWGGFGLGGSFVVLR